MFNVLLTKEEQAVKQEVREFVKKEVSRQMLRDMDAGEVQYPREYVKALADRNLLGLRFSKKYGGRDMKWTAEVSAIEEIGVLGSSLGCLYSLPSIVGEAIHSFGSEEQKEKYLKPLLKGKIFCAEALTEPRGGSDFFGATTTATPDGDHYILNGQKRFVVGAEGADIFLVYAKTPPPKDGNPNRSLGVFIVERDYGVEVKKVYGLMGCRGGGTGRIVFKDVRVPKENLVGSQDQGEEIFNRMMIPERLTSAAGANGTARAALEVAARYSGLRKAFGKEIRKFQGVSFRIADAISKLDAARSLTYTAAKTVDSGQDSRRMVSESKKISTELAWEVVNHAMQVMGGIGYTNIYPVEKFLRDMRLTMIWTGTNEIMNLLIQHEYFREIEKKRGLVRDVEFDAIEADEEEEKVYE